MKKLALNNTGIAVIHAQGIHQFMIVDIVCSKIGLAFGMLLQVFLVQQITMLYVNVIACNSE
jgi:hypothetical protein